MGQLIDKCRVLYLDDETYQRVAEEGIVKDEAKKRDLSEQLQIQINGQTMLIKDLYSRGEQKSAANRTRILMSLEGRKRLVDNILTQYQALRSSTVSRHVLRQTAQTIKEWGERSSGLNMSVRSVDADSDQVSDAFENIKEIEDALADASNRIDQTEAAGDSLNATESINKRMQEIVSGSASLSSSVSSALGEDSPSVNAFASTATAAMTRNIDSKESQPTTNTASELSSSDVSISLLTASASSTNTASAPAQPAAATAAATRISSLLLNM